MHSDMDCVWSPNLGRHDGGNLTGATQYPLIVAHNNLCL